MRRSRSLSVLLVLTVGAMLLAGHPGFAKAKAAAKPTVRAKVRAAARARARAARLKAPIIDRQARESLQKMSTYLASLPRFTVRTETTRQVVFPSGLVLDSDRAAEVAVERPNHLKVHIVSAKRDVEMFYDGSTVAIYSPGPKLYTTRPAPPTLDQLVVRAQEQEGLDLPAADFLFTSPYQKMIVKATRGSYVGKALIRGMMTDHLAFRQKGADWQLWILSGDRPLPVRLAIRDKTVKGRPWSTVTLTEWNTDPQFPAGMFAFAPPEGARQIAAANAAELRARLAGVRARQMARK